MSVHSPPPHEVFCATESTLTLGRSVCALHSGMTFCLEGLWGWFLAQDLNNLGLTPGSGFLSFELRSSSEKFRVLIKESPSQSLFCSNDPPTSQNARPTADPPVTEHVTSYGNGYWADVI